MSDDSLRRGIDGQRSIAGADPDRIKSVHRNGVTWCHCSSLVGKPHLLYWCDLPQSANKFDSRIIEERDSAPAFSPPQARISRSVRAHDRHFLISGQAGRLSASPTLICTRLLASRLIRSIERKRLTGAKISLVPFQNRRKQATWQQEQLSGSTLKKASASSP